MRIIFILLNCFVIISAGCSDKKAPKKDPIENPVVDKFDVKLERDKPIITTLQEIIMDTESENGDKWESKWVVFEESVFLEVSTFLILRTPGDRYRCIVWEMKCHRLFRPKNSKVKTSFLFEIP